MARIFGRIRSFFACIGSCFKKSEIDQEYKGQDAYFYEDISAKNENVTLASYRSFDMEANNLNDSIASEQENLTQAERGDFKAADNKDSKPDGEDSNNPPASQEEALHALDILTTTDPVISLLKNPIVDSKDETVESALAKLSLIDHIASQLESSQTLNSPVQDVQVIIKGEKGTLKDKHLQKLSKLRYIRDQEIRFFYRSVHGKNLDEKIFEQLATTPHVVVQDAHTLTLFVLNVLKHNFKEASFVDSMIYLSSMNASFRHCVQFLALRLEEMVLGSDYLTLSKAHIEMILGQDIIGARSEFVVYLAALKWIRFDFAERKKYARELFECVRFGQMTNKEITALYQPPLLEDMLRLPEIIDLIDEALIKPESSSMDPTFEKRTLLLEGKPLILKERITYQC